MAEPSPGAEAGARSILFVDDEPLYLEVARDLFPAMRPDWKFRFAKNGVEALAQLTEEPASVVVTDYQMPLMDGRELLDHIRRRFPDTMRIMLSGLAESQRVIDAAGSGHEYLPKPCDPGLLFQTIDRACYLRERVQNQALRRIIAQTSNLPSLPNLYAELVAELNAAEVCIDRAGEIIAQDVAMSAKALHVVNLSAFGLRQEIVDPREAVLYLGATAVQSLVVSHQISAHYSAGTNASRRLLDELWCHSRATATCARWLSRQQRACPQIQSQAFAGGLLHDIGKLILAANFPARFAEAQRLAHDRHISLWQAEWELFETTHAEVGAYLLALWNLPDPIVTAVHCHHEPKNESRVYWSRTFSPVTAVHLANAIVKLTAAPPAARPEELIDDRYLVNLGLNSSLDEMAEQYTEFERSV